MYCASCGSPLPRDDAAFCSQCGAKVIYAADRDDLVAVGAASVALASRWQRVGGLAVDLVVLWLFSAIPTMIVIFAGDTLDYVGDPACFDPAGRLRSECQPDFTNLMLLSFVTYPAMFIYWWISNARGASLGKLAVGTRIVRTGGQRPGIGFGAVRTAVSLVSGWAFGLGYLWAFWDGRRQAWHDKAAGTYVVRADSLAALAPHPQVEF